MGFFSRRLIPRSVRRAMHPVRSAKRTIRKAVVPKPVRKAMWTAHQVSHPVSSLSYAVEREIFTKPRPKTAVYTHPGCSVRHRSPEARAKCRNGL